MTRKMRIVIAVTAEQYKKLKEQSNRLGSSMASIVRLAIERHFEGKTL